MGPGRSILHYFCREQIGPSIPDAIYTRDNGKDLIRYLGDTPETNFKHPQLIHWLALPEEYRDPSTESALAHKLGVNRTALYGCMKGPSLRIHDHAPSHL